MPNLDELLASSFDQDISDNEEDVGGQENADSLGLELEPYQFKPFLLGTKSEDLESDTHGQTLSLAAATAEGF